MITRADAVLSLAPGAQFVMVENTLTEWFTPDIPQPSEALIDAELARLVAEQPANDARAERNQRLAQCDWTQVADAPVDKQAWATYRQMLRDITKQPNFPNSIEWPVKPE